MWKRHDEVPKEDADGILEQWDQTATEIQRGIVLQNFLDIGNAKEEIHRLSRENEALAKFKTYVHRRLDEAGVPTDPESPHKAEGCRIGGRLDIVLTAYAAHADLLAACKSWLDYFDELRRHDDPSDLMSKIRDNFHAQRINMTRAAVAKAEAKP